MINFQHHLYPFQSHYLDINGLKYHYLDEGKGDPIVMLHGNPTWSFYYRELVKAFSPQFRVIVPDHIGCGLSDKPDETRYNYTLKSRVDDLETLLNHLGINKGINLIVHDWGGMIGMVYALRHTDAISRIVITNTAGFFPPDKKSGKKSDKKSGKKSGKKSLPLRLWIIRNLKFFAETAVLGFNLFAAGALYMAPYKRLSKAVKAGLIAPYNSWQNRIATLKFVQDIPVKETDQSYPLVKYADENLHRLKHIPMLICWGKHDFVFDKDYFAEWQRRFPHAEAHWFADAGHYVLEDVPDKIISRIRHFLT